MGRYWDFSTRLLITGTNRGSEPADYHLYSTFPLEVALRRATGARVRVELAVRSESRELTQGTGPSHIRLGSIDFLPVNLTVHYRFRPGQRVRPYVGAGLNATVAWEKSGTVDSMNVSPSLGPAVQGGVEVRLNEYLSFSVDFRWYTFATTIEAPDGTRLTKLLVDPSSLGVGLAVRL
jgi:outer membrane protein